jgi:hypothetical protein
MEPVSEYVEPCIAPRDEAAIVPDEAVSIIERDHGHQVFLAASSGPAGAAGNTAGAYVLELYIPKDA